MLTIAFSEVKAVYKRHNIEQPHQMLQTDRYFIVPDLTADAFAMDICNYGDDSKALIERHHTSLSCDPRTYCIPGVFNLSYWPSGDDYAGEGVTTWMIPLSFLVHPMNNVEYTMGELHIEHDDDDCPIHDCLDCK